MKTLDIVLTSLGVLWVVVGLVLAIIKPNPTPFQLWAFRVVMSLGAACIGSILPGFIDLNGDIGELAIRAGGAIALFLLLYLVNPPKSILEKK